MTLCLFREAGPQALDLHSCQGLTHTKAWSRGGRMTKVRFTVRLSERGLRIETVYRKLRNGISHFPNSKMSLTVRC